MARKNARAKRICERKKTYMTWDEARLAAIRTNSRDRRVRVVPYECKRGKTRHWHLTSSTAAPPSVQKLRQNRERH